MGHESRSITEFDLEKYIQNSNDVNILVTASYHKERGIGTYKCMLLYKQHRKLLEGSFQNVMSPNHTTVLGLIDAVKHIRLQGVNVCIIS